jgi:hypothetical protein
MYFSIFNSQVRGGYLQKYCECTGSYVNTIEHEEMKTLVKALMNFIK